uniref:NET domain-containing protein n=1 Tax=viral metagenome TaxID=1070528 RepID=A0A6C0BC05_9ZZZZ
MEVTTENLNAIRGKIESMPKFNHVEILKILKKYNSVTLNENKYGTHVNLTDIDPTILEELYTYINYVGTQENALNEMEKQKEQFKNIYFAKDNKEIHGKIK